MHVRVLGSVEASVGGRRSRAGRAASHAPSRPARPARRRDGVGRPAHRGHLGRAAAGHRREDAAGLRLAAAQGARRGRWRAARSSRARTATSCALADDECDALRFERLLAAGAARRGAGALARPAAGRCHRSPSRRAEARRLEERRLDAVELAIDGDLAAGRHGEVIAELETLIAEQPLRENLHSQRMLALYRAGRQADALEAFRDARQVLVEEIGVEPGPDCAACTRPSSSRTRARSRRDGPRRPSARLAEALSSGASPSWPSSSAGSKAPSRAGRRSS